MREEKRAGGSLAVLGREIFYLRLGRVGRFRSCLASWRGEEEMKREEEKAEDVKGVGIRWEIRKRND